MASNDLFSQYSRFSRGILAPQTFATWILRNADMMEAILDEQGWDRFLEVELLAAEFTGNHMDEATFRHKVDAALGVATIPRGPQPHAYVIDLRSQSIRTVHPARVRGRRWSDDVPGSRVPRQVLRIGQ